MLAQQREHGGHDPEVGRQGGKVRKAGGCGQRSAAAGEDPAVLGKGESGMTSPTDICSPRMHPPPGRTLCLTAVVYPSRGGGKSLGEQAPL